MTIITKPESETVFTYEQLVLAGQTHLTRIMVLMVMGEDLDRRWSASDMTEELIGRKHHVTLGAVSYHFRRLRDTRWIVRSGKPGRVRGAFETFYKIDGRRV